MEILVLENNIIKLKKNEGQTLLPYESLTSIDELLLKNVPSQHLWWYMCFCIA